MGLRGDLGSIKGLKSTLRQLPTSIAHDVSKRAAPAMTGLTKQAFDAKRTVYGDPRPLSRATGKPLSLEKSGLTKSTLKFTAQGTIVRCVLGTKYAKYLIGKYSVLPNGALPAAWSRKLGELVQETEVSP
jgi:hypothetical protein